MLRLKKGIQAVLCQLELHLVQFREGVSKMDQEQVSLVSEQGVSGRLIASWFSCSFLPSPKQFERFGLDFALVSGRELFPGLPAKTKHLMENA